MNNFTILLVTFLIHFALSKKFHEYMSNDELKEVLGMTHNSVVPEYELVQIRHKIDRRSLSQVVEAQFSTQKKILFLNPTEGFLAGKNTKVWVGKPQSIQNDASYSLDLKFDLIPNVMEDVGEFFHDLENGAAIRVRRDLRGHTLFDGTFGPNYMIRSIPERHRNNHTLFPSNFPSLDVDGDDFRTTHHHLIFRIPNTKTEKYQDLFYPMPISPLLAREDILEPPAVVYPEILVVVDQALFSQFKRNVKKAVSYLLTFWNAVDLRFRVLDSPKVRLNIAGIVLVEGPLTFTNAYWEKNGKGRYTMNLILPQTGSYFDQGWALSNNASFDMVVLTTGYDLLTEIDVGVLRKDEGAAYLQGACNFSHSLAVGTFRDTADFQGLTSGAHEIAHLLGAPHDDEFPDKDCEWKLGFMMSYVNGSERRVRLNRCSQERIRDFLNSEKAICLWNSPPKDEPILKVLPGKYISLDEQCKAKTGLPACSDGSDNCVQLHCFEFKANEKLCSAFEPAAEGSSCGLNKYCLNAECIDESAETVPNLFTYLE